MKRGNVGLGTKEIDIVPVYGERFIPALKQSQGYEGAISHLRYLYQDVNDIRQRYVSLGFHLCEYDRFHYWERLGFSNIFEFAEANLGLDKTAVSRCMAVARTFSSNGSPNSISMHLDKKYEDFSYSQLCEMVSMDEKDRRNVKPEMTIRQIRELKKAAKETDQNVDSALNAIDSLKNILDAAQHKKSIQEFDQQMKEKYHVDQEQAEQVPGQAKSVATSQQEEKKPFEYVKWSNLQGAARAAYIKSRDFLEYGNRHRLLCVHFYDRNGKPVLSNVSNTWLDTFYYDKESHSYWVRLNQTKEELEGKS